MAGQARRRLGLGSQQEDAFLASLSSQAGGGEVSASTYLGGSGYVRRGWL